MSKPTINKSYEPATVESKWYATWLNNKAFAGQVVPGKKGYAIAIPPPNVTGVLTMGHVLNNTIQDVLARRARQKGFSVVWIPGTDHAGLATQTRVEKELQNQKISRTQLGREAFLQKTREWRDKHGGIIIEQLKRLGASCDWDRLTHTLDPDYSQAVLHAFVELYKKGLIYRGQRMINWCPASKTALSDEELVPKPQNSILYKIRYELVDQPGTYLIVSTVRPETIMGDVAIAVNPNDERYKHLIGKKAYRPLKKEAIPIIADEAVLTDFGTGVLKVTPGHDKTDFEIGQRHHLPVIDLFNSDGTLNSLAGEPFVGLDRFEARKIAVKILQEKNLLEAQENYPNTVFYSERGDVPVEPKVSEQWFLKYPHVEEAKKVVKDGIIRFYPERWVKTYLNWLDNIQDWCISRQIWWGHRIPVWYPKNADRSNPSQWHISAEGPSDPENWTQDEDTLDTWASSWLWPFAILSWTGSEVKKPEELAYWYPTMDLVTGPDIIFFWVARMIMAGLTFMPGDLEKRLPFRNVYFTGIIRDALGRKMSKSLGNSPDPIHLIEKYGADGLRLGTLIIAPQGQDIHFSEERVQLGRNFCNKLWNASRFRQMMADVQENSSLEKIIQRIDPKKIDADDEAILLKIIQTIDAVDIALTQYEFNTAVQELYRFFWSDYCDWYLEVSKSKLQNPENAPTCITILDLCMRQLLILLHPFTPFITEELWHALGYGKENEYLQNINPGTGKELQSILEKKGISLSEAILLEVTQLKQWVTEARSLKAQFNLQTNQDVTLGTLCADSAFAILEKNLPKLKKLVGFSKIDCLPTAPDGWPAAVTDLGTIFLELGSSIDTEVERAKLLKEAEKIEKAIQANQSKLESEVFVSKAPAHIIEGAKAQLAEAIKKQEEIQKLLKTLDNTATKS